MSVASRGLSHPVDDALRLFSQTPAHELIDALGRPNEAITSSEHATTLYLCSGHSTQRMAQEGAVPLTLESSYFDEVQRGDVIWVIQRTEAFDADILSRLTVADIKRDGRKFHVSSAVEPPFRILSMKKHRLRAEFVALPGGTGGYVECERGGDMSSKFSAVGRGFRTGWELTPKVAGQFEAAWSAATGVAAPKPTASDAPRPTESLPGFDPDTVAGDVAKVLREISDRRGQSDFRDQLLRAYDARCAVTGCKAVPALEAAHIIPFSGPSTHHVANGLLLRSDIHTLFDLNLIRIHPVKRVIVVDKSLQGTEYARLAGKTLRVPKRSKERPHKEALRQRWQRAQESAAR